MPHQTGVIKHSKPLKTAANQNRLVPFQRYQQNDAKPERYVPSWMDSTSNVGLSLTAHFSGVLHKNQTPSDSPSFPGASIIDENLVAA